MGKKSIKRSKKASHHENEEKRRSSHRSTAQSLEPSHEAAVTVRPPKILNPFYIESNALEEEEEHVGLLEYRSNMGDWNDDEDEYDINPYNLPNRHRELQQQQRNQLYFEWKIRIGIIIVVLIIVIWIILSLLHQNSPRSSLKISPTASPVTKTYPPTIAPVATVQPISLSTNPTLSPEERHGRDSDTKRLIPSAMPTLTPVGNTVDNGSVKNSTNDGSPNNNDD
jgi:hypothetical protein